MRKTDMQVREVRPSCVYNDLEFAGRDRFEFCHPTQPVQLEGAYPLSGTLPAKSLWSRNVPKSGEIRPTFQRAFFETTFVSSSPGGRSQPAPSLRGMSGPQKYPRYFRELAWRSRVSEAHFS